jgi:hypothetical protein
MNEENGRKKMMRKKMVTKVKRNASRSSRN